MSERITMVGLTRWVLAPQAARRRPLGRCSRSPVLPRCGRPEPRCRSSSSCPAREAFATNSRIAADLRQRRRRRAARPRRHPACRDDRRFARRRRPSSRPRWPGSRRRCRTRASPPTRPRTTARSSPRDGRTTFALVAIPARGGIEPGQAEARAAQAALAGVTVAGSPVSVTGLDALRAAAGRRSVRRRRACSWRSLLAGARCAARAGLRLRARSWRSCRC